jgi:hypothetical protein
MGDVVDLFAPKEVSPGPDGDQVLAYIRERVDFEFSHEVYIQIDRAVARVWNAIPVGGDFGADDITSAIRGLRADGVLFSEQQMHQLAELMLDALASGGCVA